MRCVSSSMSKRCHCPGSERRGPRGSEYLVKEDIEVKFAGESLLAADQKASLAIES